MEVLRLEIAGQTYIAKETFRDDYVLYQIEKDDKFLCTIGLNEDAVWESVEDVDQDLVKEIGKQIETLML